MTIAYALDSVAETNYQRDHPTHTTLTLNNIESYYNYRTIDGRIVTSFLSNESTFIEITGRIGSKTHNNEVKPEIAVIEVNTSLVNLHSKTRRLRVGLHKIKQAKETDLSDNDNNINDNNGAEANNNSSLYNFFSNESDINATVATAMEPTIPKTCFTRPSKKRPSCTNCTQPCTLLMKDILHPTKSLTQHDICNELAIHGHPKVRKINNRNRTVVEASYELANHYIYSHNKTKPKFL